jgi:hypothetical protein
MYRNPAGEKLLSAFSHSPAGTLQIVFKECGFVNAFYMPTKRSITVCYELDNAISSVIDSGYKNVSAEKAFGLKHGAFMFIFFHEFGHAVIDMEKLPILGGEEDAADRFAATILLSLPNASRTGLAREAIEGGLAFFGARKRSSIFDGLKRRNWADEHPMNEQRLFNLLCLAYGSDPTTFGDMVSAQHMPQHRLVRCEKEYKEAKFAIDELLLRKPAPYSVE